MALTVAHLSVPDPIEYRDIHLSSCRWRRQGVVCSTCTELVERADRAIRRLAPTKEHPVSVYYTTVTERADYQTVLSSTTIAVATVHGRAPQDPWRRVELDDSSDGYYREYQLGRYRSFGCPVYTEDEWQREIDGGYVVLDAA